MILTLFLQGLSGLRQGSCALNTRFFSSPISQFVTHFLIPDFEVFLYVFARFGFSTI